MLSALRLMCWYVFRPGLLFVLSVTYMVVSLIHKTYFRNTGHILGTHSHKILILYEALILKMRLTSTHVQSPNPYIHS
ncbi:hypothetical protein AHF37_06317 [Paragonimus kellicotti]|nr:hypothetical protein AHF37_06317 [Paragonimus kellicotti]